MTATAAIHCPVCDTVVTRRIPARIAEFVRARAALPASAEASSWFCDACWHVFLTPFLTNAQFARLHDDYRGSSYNDERLRHEPDYAGHQAEFEDRESNHFRLRREFYDVFLGEFYASPGLVVDLGAPDAYFGRYVFPAAEVVWEHRLAELSRWAEIEASLQRADVFFSAQVLQMAPQPYATLSRMLAPLRRDALVWLEVPVDYRGSLRANWEFLEERGNMVASGFGPLQTLHEHAAHFSKRSLTTLARRCGLQVDEIMHSYVGILGVLARRTGAPVAG